MYSTSLNPSRIFGNYRLYWTKQHGAIITLLASWLCAVLADGAFSWLHGCIGLFLVCGFHLTELLSELFRRKSSLPAFKRNWIVIYSLFTLTGAVIIYKTVPLFTYLLFPLVVTSAVFTVLVVFRLQKSALSEWLTFSVLAMAGLLAYQPFSNPDFGQIVSMWMMMALFFGVSVFTVKVRFGRMSSYWPLVYTILAACVAFIANLSSNSVVVLAVLMLIKSVPAAFITGSYRKWPVRTVGMMETGFHLLFMICFVLMFN